MEPKKTMSEYENEDAQTQEDEQDESQDSNDEGVGEDTQGDEGEDTNYQSLYEQTQAELKEVTDKYEQARNDKNGLLRKVNKVKDSKSQPSNLSDERLDKLELRQLDPSLSTTLMQDVLLVKTAKGYSEITDAYNDPMIQSYINDVRESEGKKEKVNKAMPKAQGGSSVSPGGSKQLPSQSKDWLKKLPGKNDDQVANELQERFFPK